MTVQHAGWQQKFNDGIRMRRIIARKLYEHVRNINDFPYDTDQKRTKDKRKTPAAPPWHLRSRGAAFIGSEKVIGRFYKGETPVAPKNNKKTISIRFGHSKKMKPGSGYPEDMFHYGKFVLEERGTLINNLTESEVMRIVDEAYNEC